MNDPCNMAQKSQMLLRKTIHKTKIFFHKTFLNLKSFLFAGYRKLPKAATINSKQNITESNDLCLSFSGQCETALDDVHQRKDCSMVSSKVQKNGDAESLTNMAQHISGKNIKGERRKEKNKKARGQEATRGEASSKSLAKKMKELEMMDVKDVDHVLDVEEVLHYYSRLKSPVYLDIIDKFFMDMHHEYSLPQPTNMSANTSMRRSSSMRRLGPVSANCSMRRSSSMRRLGGGKL